MQKLVYKIKENNEYNFTIEIKIKNQTVANLITAIKNKNIIEDFIYYVEEKNPEICDKYGDFITIIFPTPIKVIYENIYFNGKYANFVNKNFFSLIENDYFMKEIQILQANVKYKIDNMNIDVDYFSNKFLLQRAISEFKTSNLTKIFLIVKNKNILVGIIQIFFI